MLESQVQTEADPLALIESPAIADPSAVEPTEPAPQIDSELLTLNRSRLLEEFARLEREDEGFKRELHKFTAPRTRKQAEAARKQLEDVERANRKLQQEHDALQLNHRKLQLGTYDNYRKTMTAEDKARLADDPQWNALVSEMERVRRIVNSSSSAPADNRSDSDADRELYQDIDTAIEEAEASGISMERAEWLRGIVRTDERVKKLPPHKRMLWVAKEIAEGIKADSAPLARPTAPAAPAAPPVKVTNERLGELAKTDSGRRGGGSRTGQVTNAEWQRLKPFEWDPKLKAWGVRSVMEARQKGFITD